jgi:hypothetical protein
VGFIDPTYFKDQFGVEGKVVLLTFGLLSPNKGIEYTLDALPAILVFPRASRQVNESPRYSWPRVLSA